jgi:hypothetical protein
MGWIYTQLGETEMHSDLLIGKHCGRQIQRWEDDIKNTP